jgi:DNA (cytosine-5)-methyltransferase 1
MRFLSLFSGIEAASVASAPARFEPAAFAEIEPFPCALLKHHFPNVPNLGDVSKFKEWPDLGTVDLVCGGAPCQAFSVAGLRDGLADPRGNLTLTYLAVVDKYRPRWILFENVPGILSATSHDALDLCPPDIDLDGDDGPEDGKEVVVVDEYEADEDHAFSCFLAGLQELGYGFAYRVLDAQFVRSRSHPRAVPQRRRRVFVVGYLGDWRRAAAVLFDGESLSGNPPPRREAGEGAARGFEVGPGGGSFTDLSPTLDARCKDGPIRNQLGAGVIASTGDVSHCLNAGGMGRIDYETETMIAHALRGEGFDASEDGTGRGTPLVPVAYRTTGNDGAYETGDVVGALTTTTDPNAQVVAFSCKDHGADAGEISPTLRAMGHGDSHANAGGQVAVALPWAVRRLTPTECERLQGFPDGWTDIPYRGKRAADGPRYKALGNSWAVNCGEWIFDRIQEVDRRSILEAVA